MVGGDEVVVCGDEGKEVDCCADRSCGGGHEGGGEDLDGAADVVVMLAHLISFSSHYFPFLPHPP